MGRLFSGVPTTSQNTSGSVHPLAGVGYEVQAYDVCCSDRSTVRDITEDARFLNDRSHSTCCVSRPRQVDPPKLREPEPMMFSSNLSSEVLTASTLPPKEDSDGP